MKRLHIVAIGNSFALALMALGWTFAGANSATADGTVGGLSRRGFFGTKVGPVSEETIKRHKLEAGEGIEVQDVIPNSSAQSANIHAGDVLLTLDGTKLMDASQLVRAISGRKAGDSLAIELVHDGVKSAKKIALKPFPLETSDEFEVVYGSVTSRGGRLRTIVTKPKGAGKHPALFVIQGIGVFSVDNPIGSLSSYKTIADDFAKRGFVTLRVDKPGCGDSEGGPARDVDFDTELDGYRQGLKMLRKEESVDAEKLFLFGHSMGGVMAPLLAAEIPVKGIVVYGTLAKTWHEYMLENFRRQLELAGEDAAKIDSKLRDDAAIMSHLYNDRLSPKAIADRYPKLKDRVEEIYPDDGYFVDRSIDFFRQLAGKSLGGAWEKYTGEVLAIWAIGDYVSARDDHERIAAFVNRDHPGKATFLALEGIDHGFHRVASQRDSFERPKPGEFNPSIVETLRTWITERADVTH